MFESTIETLINLFWLKYLFWLTNSENKQKKILLIDSNEKLSSKKQNPKVISNFFLNLSSLK